MIKLHRQKNDTTAGPMEEKLRELVVAFEIVDHPVDEDDPGLPFIEESGKQVRGEKNIEDWFIILEEELNWQRSLSGDACYIDPKTGKIC